MLFTAWNISRKYIAEYSINIPTDLTVQTEQMKEYKHLKCILEAIHMSVVTPPSFCCG